jgi:enterochelin esterase-like enzyme
VRRAHRIVSFEVGRDAHGASYVGWLIAVLEMAGLVIFILAGCVPYPTREYPIPPVEAASATVTAVPPTLTSILAVSLATPANLVTPSVTLTAQKLDSPTPTLVSPTPAAATAVAAVATPGAPACQSAGGQTDRGEIISGDIASSYDRHPFHFRVYFPPCYSQDETRRYPVLYMLHGQTYTDDQWDRLGLDDLAGEMITAGEIKPLIIVMPYDRDWQQPAVSHFGDALIEDLLPWVDKNYRTLPGRENRAIGGLSRGGSWAVHLGLNHPELFGSIGAHSTPLFATDGDQVGSWLDAIPPQIIPRLYVDAGEGDSELDSVLAFEAELNRHQVPHEWHLFPGFHDEDYWRAHLRDYLLWYDQGWNY